jgi:hypothetical protein
MSAAHLSDLGIAPLHRSTPTGKAHLEEEATMTIDPTDEFADPLAELEPPVLPDLAALDAANAERLAEILDRLKDPPLWPDGPESVARSGVSSEANAPLRTRRTEKELRNAARRRQVVELRLSGCTFLEIGQFLGMSRQGAAKLYRAAVRSEYTGAATEARELELLRCDGIVRRWWPDLNNPDDVVADRATRNLLTVMRLQADLLGLRHATVGLTQADSLWLPTDGEVWKALQRFRKAAQESDRPEVPR